MTNSKDLTGRLRGRWMPLEHLARLSEPIVITFAALFLGVLIFSVFLMVQGISPVAFARVVWLGGFGTPFSIANALERAAPLILAALCVALPAQLGLVIIGGEGAIVMGGVAAAVASQIFAGWPMGWFFMALAGAGAGALWIGAIGWMRHARAVNETISSLLMAYIAIALMNHLIEGPLRDPASLNKPATLPIGDAFSVGRIPGLDVHWGLAAGICACLLAWILMARTTLGMAARFAGANPRAAQLQALAVGKLMIGFTALAGAGAGLAGYFEVAAVHQTANASLASGFGFAAILVSFLARHNPLAIIPVAMFIGGLDASSGLVQRRLDMPDATMQVLQGTLFLSILSLDAAYGRVRPLAPALWGRRR